MKTPFLGGFYQSRSKYLADQVCINLFPELVDAKGAGREVASLLMCPGLDLIATVGNGPIRALHTVPLPNPVLYVVSGNQVYVLNASYQATNLGTIGSFSGPVSIIDNGALGNQVALFDGTSGYISTNLGPVSVMSLPFSVPATAAYQDGFGIVNQSNTNEWFQSNLNDLSTWNALNFAVVNTAPDQVIALAVIHDEVWVLSQYNTEIWYNAGNLGFVFQKLTGVAPQQGCVAPFSPAIVGESLMWLAQNVEGQGFVLMAEGYQLKRVSTHAIEYQIAQYDTIADAIGYSYQQEGHTFYVMTFPSGNQTWVYDISTGLWHQRASLLNGAWNRHWGNCYAFFNQLPLVGDYMTGNIYQFDMDQTLDNGTQRKWERSWRALEKPSLDPVQFRALTIDMEMGINVPNGVTPNLMLTWSDDGGYNWAPEVKKPIGALGQTAYRARFNRLGGTKRNTGLDRIFKLSSSDPFAVSLTGAEIE